MHLHFDHYADWGAVSLLDIQCDVILPRLRPTAGAPPALPQEPDPPGDVVVNERRALDQHYDAASLPRRGARQESSLLGDRGLRLGMVGLLGHVIYNVE